VTFGYRKYQQAIIRSKRGFESFSGVQALDNVDFEAYGVRSSSSWGKWRWKVHSHEDTFRGVST
jgi:hypothetical protein